MNKKVISVLSASVLFAALAFPTYVTASTPTARQDTRIAGVDRFETAQKIAEKLNSGTVNNVILTSGYGFADALASGTLAHKLNAPILLANLTADSSTNAMSYITSHLAKNGTVYIIGGEGVVGSDFVTKLNQLGYANIKRIGGTDRYDTDVKIIKELNVPQSTPVVIVDGENYPDALSVSGIAAFNGWPILLVTGDTLSSDLTNFLIADNPLDIYVVGGVGALKESIASKLWSLFPSANKARFAGFDRFGTSYFVSETLAKYPDEIYLTTGLNYADALAGSSLAAQKGSPIILVDPSKEGLSNTISNYLSSIAQKTNNVNTVYALGGTGAVPESINQEAITRLSNY